MTALTADAKRVEQAGSLVAMPVKASTKIYKDSLVKIAADGYAAPCAAEAGAVYAGMAYEQVDNSAGSAGDLEVRVQVENSFFANGSGFVAADAGKKVYALDDDTVQLAAGTNLQLVGKIMKVVSATEVLVRPDSDLTK